MARTNSSGEMGLVTTGSGPKPVVARRTRTARIRPTTFLKLKRRIRKGSGHDNTSLVKRLVGQNRRHRTGYGGMCRFFRQFLARLRFVNWEVEITRHG